jgi:predicted nucleotidyltransferase
MNTEDALATLRCYESDLRARGICHVAVFGSFARGENRPDSDLDIMIDVDPAVAMTVFDYVGLKEFIAGLFEGPVDVVRRDGLKPYIRPAATAQAIYAF